MRFQGRVVDWNEDRGFGFIQPNGGGNKVFAHISQFPPGEPRPSQNELVNYELGEGKDGKPAAKAIRFVNRPATRSAHQTVKQTKPWSLSHFFIATAMVAVLAAFAWSKFSTVSSPGPLAAAVEGREEVGDVLDTVSPGTGGKTSQFHCDGRSGCHQMTSCAEAKHFLAHCPWPKMDGDGDGVPCEQTLCGH